MKNLIFGMVIWGHLVYHKISTFLGFYCCGDFIIPKIRCFFRSIHEFIQLFCLKIKCLHQIYWWESWVNYIHAVGFAELSLLSLGFTPATIDYFLNKAKIKKPNNKVRFFTGILLGISIGGIEQLLINAVNHWFN